MRLSLMGWVGWGGQVETGELLCAKKNGAPPAGRLPTAERPKASTHKTQQTHSMARAMKGACGCWMPLSSGSTWLWQQACRCSRLCTALSVRGMCGGSPALKDLQHSPPACAAWWMGGDDMVCFVVVV